MVILEESTEFSNETSAHYVFLVVHERASSSSWPTFRSGWCVGGVASFVRSFSTPWLSTFVVDFCPPALKHFLLHSEKGAPFSFCSPDRIRLLPSGDEIGRNVGASGAEIRQISLPALKFVKFSSSRRRFVPRGEVGLRATSEEEEEEEVENVLGALGVSCSGGGGLSKAFVSLRNSTEIF